MNVVVVDHPLVRVRLSTMRDERTTSAVFRAALCDLTTMLVYEATRSIRLEPRVIRTPLIETEGYSVAEPPLFVPILRAGLGMAEYAHHVIPEAQIGFLGLNRDEETLQPKPYLAALPDDLRERTVILLDPMLATGGSLAYAIRLVRERGATDVTAVCALAAPEGLQFLDESGLSVRVVTASIDQNLNESGFIVPGLGDAGDRQYGPFN